MQLALCMTNRFSLARKADNDEMCHQRKLTAEGAPSHGACRTNWRGATLMVLSNCSTVAYVKESLASLHYFAGATGATATRIVAGPSVDYGLIDDFCLIAMFSIKLTTT